MAENPAVVAGRRDKRVRLERGTKQTGRSTRPVVSWDLLREVWANKADAGGSERLRAESIDAVFDATFTIPYFPDMDPELVDVPAERRIVYAGRAFEVVSARQLGRRRGIELLTRTGTRIDA